MGLAVFEAKYAGKCGGCGEGFAAGRMVGYVDGNLVTEDCQGPMDIVSSGPKDIARWLGNGTCPRCFCVHSGEC
jgi:hypothetical protein